MCSIPLPVASPPPVSSQAPLSPPPSPSPHSARTPAAAAACQPPRPHPPPSPIVVVAREGRSDRSVCVWATKHSPQPSQQRDPAKPCSWSPPRTAAPKQPSQPQQPSLSPRSPQPRLASRAAQGPHLLCRAQHRCEHGQVDVLVLGGGQRVVHVPVQLPYGLHLVGAHLGRLRHLRGK